MKKMKKQKLVGAQEDLLAAVESFRDGLTDYLEDPYQDNYLENLVQNSAKELLEALAVVKALKESK